MAITRTSFTSNSNTTYYYGSSDSFLLRGIGILVESCNTGGGAGFDFTQTTDNKIVRIKLKTNCAQNSQKVVWYNNGTTRVSITSTADGEGVFNFTIPSDNTPPNVISIRFTDNSGEIWYEMEVEYSDGEIETNHVAAGISSNIKLGNALVSRAYLGATQISGIFLGANQILGSGSSPSASWEISNNGTTLTRIANFPFDIINSATTTNSLVVTPTTSFSFDVVFEGNGVCPYEIDGINYTNGNSLYRDCVARLRNGASTTIGFVPQEIPGLTDYFKFNKDGTINSVVSSFEEYTPDVPSNAFTYDAINDQIIIAAGTWDCSDTSNTPVTLTENIVLSNMGRMYADTNFNYRLSFSAPITRIYFPTGKSGVAPARTQTQMRSNNYCYFGTATSRTSINKTALTDTTNMDGSYFYSTSTTSTRTFYFRNTSHYIYIYHTVNPTILNSLISDNYDWTLSMPTAFSSGARGTTTLVTHYEGGTSKTWLSDVSPTGSSVNLPATTADLLNMTQIDVDYRGVSTRTFSTQSLGSVTLDGTWNKAYSYPITAETRQNYDDPTQGTLELGYGRNTGYYANINASGQLESITTAPLYEVTTR